MHDLVILSNVTCFNKDILLGVGFTYGLMYHTPHKDHLVRRFESNKRVTRRDTPSVCLALVENVNEIMSCIVHLKEKNVGLEESIKMATNHY